MSIQTITSDLLVDLSTADQQIIAGGQGGGDQEEYSGDKKRDRYYCRYCYDCRRSYD
ncbi:MULTISPECIES: hypothetical protein [unclassified Anabaena]|uniref:hypothetical protein n=1 Tax=unclassified Anabaena TaxID=2619674 RepID=UPI002B1EE5BD|nr:hypothetical protein [Anabaena sp. UHCC 0399]MEA5566080.1 hypothetical protein [Anabaena sp. UHCC 0399]